MQMKWDDSGWYKWNESEMKYISQVKEPEEDIGPLLLLEMLYYLTISGKSI